MGLKNNPHERQDTIFATILSDGKIHVAATEDTEGAVKREYETSDGKKGEKWELLYTELSGMIQKVDFHEGDYGINLLIVIGDDEDEKPVTLALGTESNFGEDMMKKLPNIDLKRAVTLAPFSFENDKGKKQRGITVTQEDKKGNKTKLPNFYYDAEKKVVANGYPKPPAAPKGKTLTKSQWRKYFGEAREFLIADITERFEISEDASKSQADKDYDAMG